MSPFVIFLDENHCRNPHLLAALEMAGISAESLLKYFDAGTLDVKWLPLVSEQGWCLLTTDARIRTNSLERLYVKQYALRMFYFSRNNIPGEEMGRALTAALPKMRLLYERQAAPFTASITRTGEVNLRDTF